MTGGGWLGWRFKKKTPIWFKLIVGLLAADSVAHFSLLFTVSTWASATRDAVHTHPEPFRDGFVYWVQPWVGQYLAAWWIGVGLLIILLLLLVLNRNQLERGL